MIRVSDGFQPSVKAPKRHQVVFQQAVSILTEMRLLKSKADSADNSQPYARRLVGDDSKRRSRFGQIQ